MCKKKIVVTGSSGMLGSVLCNSLVKDYQIFGIDLDNRTKISRFIKCDITEAKAVKDVFINIEPDIVIHAAAYTDVDGCEINRNKAKIVNTFGSINVAKACKRSGCAFFFISTDYIFNGRKKTSYCEEDRPSPLNVYGTTKLDAERFIQNIFEDCAKFFIIRTAWLYGKAGKNFVDTIRNAAKSKPLLKVINDQIGAPTHVLDLAKALKLLIKKVENCPEKFAGIYHITNSGKCSWYDFAEAIVSIDRLKVKILPIRSKALKRVTKRPKNSLLNNSKFNRLIHKPMRHWKKALYSYLKIK